MQKSRVFGGNFIESLANYNHESQSWKMSQICLPWGCQKYSDPFPKSGIMQNGVLYQLHNLELPTYEREYSLLPTPVAADVDKHTPGGLVRLITYPEGQKMYSKGDHRNLPTPTAHDYKVTGAPGDYRRARKNGSNLQCHVIPETPDLPTGERPRLHPQFVEWMMGFPIGWLNLEP